MFLDWIHSGERHAVLENFIFHSHAFRSDEMHFSLLVPGELCKHYENLRDSCTCVIILSS